jgi:hypothetical protein
MKNKKYILAARLTILMVLEIMEKRHGWSANETISKLSKCTLYQRLSNYSTKFWMDNPHDLADLFEKELKGEPLVPEDYFK